MKYFDKLKRLGIHSKNKLSIGYKGRSKFLIKEYVIREGREKEDLLKVKCEILGYKNLSTTLNLPKIFKADYNKRLLITEFVDFKNITLSKSNLDKILKFYLNIRRINAKFLPKVDYGYYKKSLYLRAKELEKEKIIKDIQKEFSQFEKNKTLINKSAKNFSHGDLHLGNIKYSGKKLTLLDLEHSRRDNLMYDLATLYVDIYNNPLSSYFLKQIGKIKGFDKKLFLMMIDRRCIEVLYALKQHNSSQNYKNARALINTS